MLGSNIKKLRLLKELTQEELGKVLNKTKNNISQYETGKREPDNETLRVIADFFNVSIDYLLDRNLSPNNSYGNVELSPKAEKDIQKSLNQTLEQLENAQDGLMFDGDPIDDETRELLKMSLENSMRLAKQIAKNKYTPKKYK